MKKTLFALSYLLIANALVAQTFITQVKPKDERLWGYINSEGKMIIDAKFKKCSNFSESGRAIFYERGKGFMIMDTEGNIIPKSIEDFGIKEIFGFGMKGYQEGLLSIKANGKWGYLDTEGKVAIDPKYDKATVFNGKYASAQIGGLFYVLDKSGNETKVTIPSLHMIKEFKEGLAPYVLEDKKTGFIDPTGKIVIEAQFKTVGYFTNDLAWARDFDNKIGYIDKTGKWVITPQFQDANDFEAVSGLARIKVDDAWAYVDKSGKIIKMQQTEIWKDFTEGLCMGRTGDLYGFYDKTGTWIIPAQYEGVRAFLNGFAAAKKDGLWGFINKKGEWVIDPIYANVKDLELIK